MQAEQDAPDFSITSEQYGRWDDLRRTAQYWDGWFTEWEAWAVERAARAEAFGIDMFAPFVWASDTFQPEVYPEYEQRWRGMIAAMREVYSGEIALWVLLFAVEGLTFADAVDAVVISMDSGGIIDKEDILDRNQPTMEQIIKVAKDKIEPARRTLADSGIPIYYTFGATSADGQRSTEDVEELAAFVPDF
jgi:hypothetical protein